jgi:release factor glutamine methyltransferase
VVRRAAGEPLEYVVGWAEFGGLRIVVASGVFVPRRRSELLATEAAKLARTTASRPAVVVDLCCGSGAIGALIAHAVPGIELYAADVDPAAVAVAAANVAPYGGRAVTGDLFDALPEGLLGRVDVIAANAPYVPSEAIALMPPEARDYEPREALDGGDDGLAIQRRVVAGARDWLAPDGALLIETSKHQSPATTDLLARAGFKARIVRNPEIGGTVVIGRLPEDAL